MTPYSSWKKNKGRVDLRSYTREFQKKFSTASPKKRNLEAGKLYAVKYLTDSVYPTDKHHFSPLFLSFGRFMDDEIGKHSRGVNLFYLTVSQSLEILEDFFRLINLNPNDRAVEVLKLHSKYLKIFPYAFKNLEERRILNFSEIDSSEWGMVPLLHKYLIGNFNSTALDKDFQLENKELPKITKKRKKKVSQLKPETAPVETQEIVLESDGTFDNFSIFDEE
jgi:hypothetical protein